MILFLRGVMKKTKAVIDRFEGDFAVVSVNSEFLNIPKSLLPEESKEGEVVYITITDEEKETRVKENLAKDLLNEVLREE